MGKLSGVVARFNSGGVIAIALGLVLAVAGASYYWVRFPISAPVGGFALAFAPIELSAAPRGTPLSLGTAYLAAMVLAVAAEIAGYPRLRKVLAYLAILALLYHLLNLACVDGRWIEKFVAEGVAFLSQLSFLNSNFVLNDGEDNTFTYLTSFEYLVPDRLTFIWQSLGHGWIFAFIGACLVALAPGGRSTGTGRVLRFAAGGVLLLVIAGFIARPLWGEYLHLAGDRQLAQGADAAALDSYATAMAIDPIRKRSLPLMLKVSKAHYALKGRYDSYALLYLAGAALSSKAYDDGIAALRILRSMRLIDLPYRDAYLQAAAKTERSLYVARGLTQFGAGDKPGAERDFMAALGAAVPIDPVPIDVTYMAARIEADLRLHARCAQRAMSLLNSGTVGRKSARADLNNTAGDCYAQMFNYSAAREAFFRSFELDNRTNYRGYQGLSGS